MFLGGWGLSAQAAAAPGLSGRWLHLETPHFEAISDAREGRARQELEELERFRAALVALEGPGRISALPTRVYLFASEDHFNRLLTERQRQVGFTEGLFVPALTENLLAIDLRADRREDGRVARHEFVHLATRGELQVAPLWLQEGVAECLSTARFKGGKVELGEGIPGHVTTLDRTAGLPIELLFGLNPRTLPGLDARGAAQFYAQSWSLTHFLLFGASGTNRPAADRVFASLAAGELSVAAFRKGLGWEPSDVAAKLKQYRREKFLLREIPVEPVVATAIRVRPAASAEVWHWLGRWRMARGLTNEARADFLAAGEGTASAELGLALLDLRAGRAAEAETRLRRVLAADPNSVEAAFYLVAALDARVDSPMERETIRDEQRRLLAQTRKAWPDFGPAHRVLGFLEEKSRRPADAVKAFREAVRVDVFDDASRLGLALALLSTGAREEPVGLLREVAENPRDPRAAKAARDVLGRLAARNPGRTSP